MIGKQEQSNRPDIVRAFFGAHSLRPEKGFRFVVLFFMILCIPGAKALAVDFQSQILDAYKQGKKSVRIRPGVYRLTCPEGRASHLEFRGLNDFEIEAAGSTIIFESADKSGISFIACRNLKIDGAEFTREIPPFSQGEIIAVAPDRTYLDVRVHDGYSVDFSSAGPVVSVFDSKNRKLKENVFDRAMSVKRYEKREGREARFHMSRPFPAGMPVAVGDLAAWRKRIGGEIVFWDCAGIAFTDITIRNACGLAVCERGGDGGNYYRYKVTYAKPPKGATEAPLLSGASDGFHSDQVRTGPVLEHCLWEGMHDDAVNIHGRISLVTEVQDRQIIVNSRMRENPRVGDRIQLFDPACTLQAQAKVLSCEPLMGYQQPELKLAEDSVPVFRNPEKAKFLRITLDKSSKAGPGWQMVNLNACGSGYVIRNCVTREHRARGFLLYADNGVVENNLIERCGYGGIVVAPTFRRFGEGPYACNLVIRNNTIRKVGFATEYWNNGLTITAWEHGGFVELPGGHRNLLIEGNRFEDNDGPNIVITSAIGVKVIDNVFMNPMHQNYHGVLKTPIDEKCLILLRHCKDISMSGNQVVNPGPFMERIVDSSDLEMAGKLSDGFRILRTKKIKDTK